MKKIFLLLAVIPFFAGALEFNRVFQSNMVLQRDRELEISGKAEPGEKLTLSFGGKNVSGVAGKDGRWQLRLPAFPASAENRSMRLTGEKKSITLENILVGEVWFCSGQSNMNWPLAKCRDGEKAVAEADHPLIRCLDVYPHLSKTKWESFRESWQVVSPKNAGKLSGVGFYFARELHKKLGVPIGLVSATRGGTMIEAWIPEGALDPYPEIKKQMAEEIYKKPAGAKPRFQDKPANQPHVISNTTINPVRHFAFRGVIWYQGCSNIWFDSVETYHIKQKALFEGMKTLFRNPELKFYLVQLAPLERSERSRIFQLRIWLAQQRFADSDPAVHMAVINDFGNLKDIHPIDKEPVGKRLANLALKHEYGHSIKADFPRVSSAVSVKGAVVLRFKHAGSWKTTDGKAARNFEIAGADGKFYPATVILAPGMLKVSAKEVAEPVRVRYMFDCRHFGNLVNEVGLPPGTFEIKTIGKEEK